MDREFYPDWRVTQQEAVEAVCADKQAHVWVAEDNGAMAGFVAVMIRSQQLGEIYMIAVDPDHQRKGIGSALTTFAVDWLRSEGVAIAMVETGADPGHAPARRTYEQSGFHLLPAARYFKKL
jgi:GNAT superfamily N-acetyltransferase